MRRMLDMLKEQDEYSLTRIIALVGFAAFLLGSLYLLVKGQTWGNYETFSTIAGGGGAATQVLNKLINSKLNTPPGEGGKPIIKEKEGE